MMKRLEEVKVEAPTIFLAYSIKLNNSSICSQITCTTANNAMWLNNICSTQPL